MSLDELREQNKRKVIETALACFVERGIFNTKITDIAKAAGLTDRSVYRYFESKADLVLEAALLFWDSNVKKAEDVYINSNVMHLSGAEQIKEILLAYSHLYFSDRKKLIFIHEAEIYLCHERKSSQIRNRPPAPYSSFSAPLSKAIKCGTEDGSVRTDINLEAFYYNSYDSLLGLMQKMAISNEYTPISDENAERRLRDFCEILTASFINRSACPA
ncbi:MAG: TetR/AcrR family transcriptional regulator [Clostridiales bacterium]|jgi:AcrR family transcriptional regulator|nr:TetR/AcrR family transcriptional regulator [Clostridiales bacterium]